MSENVRSSRSLQIAAWITAIIFVLGWFVPVFGACTSPIAGAWLVRTQKPLRGFLWIMILSLFPRLLANWRQVPLTDPGQAGKYLVWTILVVAWATLPFVLYRLVSPRLPGFISTLPLPLAAIAAQSFGLKMHLGGVASAAGATALLFWLAAVIVWMWRQEFGPLSTGAIFFSTVGLSFVLHFSHVAPAIPIGQGFGWACFAAFLGLSGWALLNSKGRPSWAQRPEVVARLQSPYTGNPLTVVIDRGHEELVSSSGERFAIRNGVPVFLRPEDLSGDNGKYNHLYETIGGFYDDTQRVFCALKGFDRDSYLLSYMRLLDVKPGDSVLETSVGTGLNLQFLPRGAKLSGLDLSPEMLANCAENLRRWKLNADLYLGNAERLPFADASFDVVFHSGGINFFNDRAQAIREMIRVCKPGGRLLVADETEKHVQEVYEKMPGGLYKDRKQPVSAPVDLIPPEMEGTELKVLKDGTFYAITFRKPASRATNSRQQSGETVPV